MRGEHRVIEKPFTNADNTEREGDVMRLMLERFSGERWEALRERVAALPGGAGAAERRPGAAWHGFR